MPNTELDAPERLPPDDDEISLLDLAVVLAKHKKLIIGFPIFVAIVAAIVSVRMTPIYTATTRLLPPQGRASAAGLLGQLGGFGGLAGGALGLKTPGDLYVGLLKSRTAADDLIKRFDLKKLYRAKFMSDARGVLRGASTVSVDKDGLITIAVDSKDPKLSAALANGYVEELMKLTNRLAVTEAGQRRLFFGRQLREAQSNLVKVQMAAKEALQQGGITMVDEQGKSMVQTTATLRAQIVAKEVQIGAMQSFATEQNPELVRAKRELAALRQQMERIEGATGGIGGVAKKYAPDHSADGLRSLSLLRDVKYYQVLVDLLSKQYEIAKIDEAKEGAVVQVVDKAIVPDRRSRPKRTIIVAVSGFAAGFIAVLCALLLEAFERAGKNPENKEQLDRLRRYLAWR